MIKSSTPKVQPVWICAMVVFLVPFLLGMGGGGDSTENQIPLPQRNYSAVITDSQGIQTEVHRITWEGKIFLKGNYGDALTTIPFNKIQKVEMTSEVPKDAQMVILRITLFTGNSVNLQLERSSKIYGETEFGNFEIFVSDLKSVQVKGTT